MSTKKISAKRINDARKREKTVKKVSRGAAVFRGKNTTHKQKESVKNIEPKSETSQKSVQVNVLGVDGKVSGKTSLPAELFAAKVNRQLLAQAVRVYLANQRRGNASTKTRGEVEGSTRKIYRQKGTGRARHGGIRAPIFVGGGISFGPKPRDYSLDFPKKMKKRALSAALTSQLRVGNIIVVDGLENLEPKTKLMAQALLLVGASDNTLLVLPNQSETVVRATRNIAGVDMLAARSLHTYAVLSHKKLIVMKEALPILKETFVK